MEDGHKDPSRVFVGGKILEGIGKAVVKVEGISIPVLYLSEVTTLSVFPTRVTLPRIPSRDYKRDLKTRTQISKIKVNEFLEILHIWLLIR